MQAFFHPKLWLGMGWALLVAVAVLSLAFVPAPDTPVPANFDKYEHLLAYAVLAGYWCQLFDKRPIQLLCACLLIIFGGALELAQAFATHHRSGDWWDLLANTLGVAVGWVSCQTRLGTLIKTLDDWLKLKR
jgi:VanZ family protein